MELRQGQASCFVPQNQKDSGIRDTRCMWNRLQVGLKQQEYWKHSPADPFCNMMHSSDFLSLAEDCGLRLGNTKPERFCTWVYWGRGGVGWGTMLRLGRGLVELILNAEFPEVWQLNLMPTATCPLYTNSWSNHTCENWTALETESQILIFEVFPHKMAQDISLN